jgi:hypothetical protein
MSYVAEAEPIEDRLFAGIWPRPLRGLSDRLGERDPLGHGEDDRPSRTGRGLARPSRPRISERKPAEAEKATTTTAPPAPRTPAQLAELVAVERYGSMELLRWSNGAATWRRAVEE